MFDKSQFQLDYPMPAYFKRHLGETEDDFHQVCYNMNRDIKMQRFHSQVICDMFYSLLAYAM